MVYGRNYKTMINLNDTQFEGTRVFNDGKAGLVTDVTIEVEKKQPSDLETSPDYRLIVEDQHGGRINRGFWYFKPLADADAKKNGERQTQEISRLVHLARAVMGADYELPAVNSVKEAYDVVFTMVRDNAGSKKFNVFTTYGSVNKPSKYLELRYFDFIESAVKEEDTKFSARNTDLLTRVIPDEQEVISTGTSSDKWV